MPKVMTVRISAARSASPPARSMLAKIAASAAKYPQVNPLEARVTFAKFAERKKNDEDLKKLKARLDKVKAPDFYGVPARAAAEQQLAQCEEQLDAYAQEVDERIAERQGCTLANACCGQARTGRDSEEGRQAGT